MKNISITGSCNIASGDGAVVINGKIYTGRNITINNGQVVIDGKPVGNIGLVGSVDGGTATVVINGDVGSVKTASGDVHVTGNVAGSVKTMSGDVDCHDIYGDVETMSGDITSVRGDV